MTPTLEERSGEGIKWEEHIKRVRSAPCIWFSWLKACFMFIFLHSLLSFFPLSHLSAIMFPALLKAQHLQQIVNHQPRTGKE